MKRRMLSLLLCLLLCFGLTTTALARNGWYIDEDGNIYQEEPKQPEDPKDPTTPTTPTTPSDTSGSGSEDDDDGYPVSVPGDIRGGRVKATPNSAGKGDTVTLTVTPDEGYELGRLTVTDARGNALELKDLGGGRYSFIMPGSRVKVDASFVRIGSANTPGTGFTDVPATAYYAGAVAWAVANGVTSGNTASTFAPNEPCTRAQIVTFLWRASGSPAASGENPFTDVPAGAYYHDAVLWAVEKGITSGLTATAFGPNSPCTRGQAVTFLHRMEGRPAAASAAGFTDVAADSFCAGAVAWAVERGVTSGKTAAVFAPNETCTRGQIVTFLYRDMAA